MSGGFWMVWFMVMVVLTGMLIVAVSVRDHGVRQMRLVGAFVIVFGWPIMVTMLALEWLCRVLRVGISRIIWQGTGKCELCSASLVGWSKRCVRCRTKWEVVSQEERRS